MTWYMILDAVPQTWACGGRFARPRVIRGTQAKPLPLLPSGPGGVYSRPLHEARSLTTHYVSSGPNETCAVGRSYVRGSLVSSTARSLSPKNVLWAGLVCSA